MTFFFCCDLPSLLGRVQGGGRNYAEKRNPSVWNVISPKLCQAVCPQCIQIRIVTTKRLKFVNMGFDSLRKIKPASLAMHRHGSWLIWHILKSHCQALNSYLSGYLSKKFIYTSKHQHSTTVNKNNNATIPGLICCGGVRIEATLQFCQSQIWSMHLTDDLRLRQHLSEKRNLILIANIAFCLYGAFDIWLINVS